MIRKIKSAFSLSELLIVLAIISIISVMLISISKAGIEKAYSMYYYTGYSTLVDILSDSIGKDPQNRNDFWFVNNMARLLDTSAIAVNGDYTIKAKNGIKYIVKPRGTYTKYNPSQTFYYFPIYMIIPSSNAEVEAHFTFFPDEMNGILAPGNATKTIGSTTTSIDLFNRRDLLPFYIENGIDGVILPYVDTATQNLNIDASNYHQRSFYSFKDAICQLSDKDPNDNSLYWSKKVESLVFGGCGSSATRNQSGFLKVANPQKI